MPESRRRSQPKPQAQPSGSRLTVTQATQVVAAVLIFATIYFLFAALPISAVPITSGVGFTIQPAVVVPIFVGLAAGPLMGALVGLAGRLLGDLLAGQGVSGYGLVYTGLLGLVAGFGYGRLGGYRTLRQVAIAFAWAWLACAVASVASVLLLQTLIWRQATLADGLNKTVSQILSGGIMATLLISTPLWVWGRRKS
jgi:uncharacterized membrane protein